jgi:hypothetical protein
MTLTIRTGWTVYGIRVRVFGQELRVCGEDKSGVDQRVSRQYVTYTAVVTTPKGNIRVGVVVMNNKETQAVKKM